MSIKEVETQIMQTEERIAGLEGSLANPGVMNNQEAYRKVSTDHASAKKALEELMQVWETKSSER